MDGNIISFLSFILHTLNFDLVLNLITIALKIYLIYIIILKTITKFNHHQYNM
jgi:hypothetical protein